MQSNAVINSTALFISKFSKFAIQFGEVESPGFSSSEKKFQDDIADPVELSEENFLPIS